MIIRMPSAHRKKMTVQKFYAHSEPGIPKEEWQEYEGGLESATGRACKLVESFGMCGI